MPEMPVNDESAIRVLGVISDRLRELVDEVRGLRNDLQREREARERQEQHRARRATGGRR